MQMAGTNLPTFHSINSKVTYHTDFVRQLRHSSSSIWKDQKKGRDEGDKFHKEANNSYDSGHR